MAKIIEPCATFRGKNLVGERFGRRVVLSLEGAKRDATGKALSFHWRCRCDCGNEIVCSQSTLKNPTIISCGCFQKEQMTERFRTHGCAREDGSRHPIYAKWIQMRRRCVSEEPEKRIHYLDRGITVCERWNDYTAFASDMLPTWRPGLTIERKDVNKGYNPENCCWATTREQNNNRTDNVYVEFRGERHTVGEWATIVNIPYDILWRRLRRKERKKWSVEQAMTLPIKNQRRLAHPLKANCDLS